MHTIGLTGTKWWDSCPGFTCYQGMATPGALWLPRLAGSPCFPALDAPERRVSGRVVVAFVIQPRLFKSGAFRGAGFPQSSVLALTITVLHLVFAPSGLLVVGGLGFLPPHMTVNKKRGKPNQFRIIYIILTFKVSIIFANLFEIARSDTPSRLPISSNV